MRKIVGTLAALGLFASVAAADSVGPAGTFNGVSFGVVKTPPLTSSTVVSVPLSYHSTFAYTNWAGIGFFVNFDPTEVNYIGTTGINGHFVTYAGGGGPSPIVTVWNSNAVNSGIFNGPSSVPFPVARVTFHATNTNDPGLNSDVDITFNSGWTYSPFNIFHVTAAQESGFFSVGSSALLYVPFGATGRQWQPVPPGQGTWIHYSGTTFTIHAQQSMFFGTSFFMSGQGGIGVEHVPEPASAACLLAGLGTLVFARRRGA
jgi:hypothetical protein